MSSPSTVKPISADASNEREISRVDKDQKAKWLVSILVSILVPTIGVAAGVIQFRLQQRAAQEAKDKERIEAIAKAKEDFCQNVTNALVELDECLKKTNDSMVLAQWGRSDWDKLDDALRDLRKIYLRPPPASDPSLADKLKNYSEFVGEKWRGPAPYKKYPEPTRRKYYQESSRYFSDAHAAVESYRAETALQSA